MLLPLIMHIIFRLLTKLGRVKTKCSKCKVVRPLAEAQPALSLDPQRTHDACRALMLELTSLPSFYFGLGRLSLNSVTVTL